MAIFDKEASTYDSWYKTSLGNYVFTKESSLLLDMMGDVSNKFILEVGCATGIHSRYIKTDNNQIIGVDISRDMIKQAKQFESDSLQFSEMNALDLTFEDNSFDIVFSATMIEFVDDKERLFTELLRVLKPGGKLIIGTIQKDSSFYDLYQTEFFQKNTVFKYANFLSLEELKSLSTKYYIDHNECLFNSPQEIEENESREDIKKDKPGSFLVCVYQKGEQ